MLGRRSQRDFQEEIRAHLALETERLRAQGMSPTDAERARLDLKFGGILMHSQREREALVRHGLEVTVNREIGEVQYGKWTGRSLKTLARTKLWSTIQRWPSAVRFPDGETLRDIALQVSGNLEDRPFGASALPVLPT